MRPLSCLWSSRWLVAALSAGCTSSGTSQGGVAVSTSGTIAGQPVGFVDVASLASQGADLMGGISFAEVFMTDKLSACGWFTGENANRQSLTTLSLLAQENGAPPLPTFHAGTYSIGGSYNADAGISVNAQAVFTVTDASCQTTSTCNASKGSITFSAITPQSISGSFDLDFQCSASGPGPMPAPSHLTGSFTAPQCQGAVVGGEGGACHP